MIQEPQIESILKQANAILGEANARARTGRQHPDVGALPAGTSLARLIDHTLLKPEATARQIEMLCLEARQYHFASVCVNSVFVPLAAELLRESDVKVCTVVGFPLGATLPQVKVVEAQLAIARGAHEVDMVMHIGALKHRDLVALFDDISEVAAAAHEGEALCKVILETSLLSDEEIIMACHIAKLAGADFVKTSTGFGGGGATAAHIALMRHVVGVGVGVKASGGVRDLATAQAMVEAGANRIGTSSGLAIVQAEGGASPSAGEGY